MPCNCLYQNKGNNSSVKGSILTKLIGYGESMVLIICTKNESNLTNRYWDMVPDRQKVWTDGRRQNYIPPTSSGDNKKSFEFWNLRIALTFLKQVGEQMVRPCRCTHCSVFDVGIRYIAWVSIWHWSLYMSSSHIGSIFQLLSSHYNLSGKCCLPFTSASSALHTGFLHGIKQY